MRYGSLRDAEIEAFERHRRVRRCRRAARWFRRLFGLRERWPIQRGPRA